MKITKSILKNVLIGVVLILISCNNQESYLKVIPSNAKLVSTVDAVRLFNKLGITKTKLSLLLGEEQESAPNVFSSLSNLIDNHESTGLDFTAPICVFQTTSIYAVAKINNTDTFLSFLDDLKRDGFASSARITDGLHSASLFDVCEAYFDDTALLLCLSSDEYGNMPSSREAKRMFRLEEDEMFVSTDKFKELQAVTADAAVYHSHRLPEGKIELLSSLSCEPSKIILSTNVLNADKKIDEMLDEIDDHTYLINGKFTDLHINPPFQFLSIGVDGEWLLKTIKSNQDAKPLLFAIERGIDIEKMIKSVDGDLAFVISDYVRLKSDEMPEMTMLAKVKNTDFLNDVDYWMSSMGDYGIRMQEIAENQYQLTFDGLALNWGVTAKNELFISTSPSFSPIHKQTNVYAPHNVQDNKLFVYTDLKTPLETSREYAEIDMICSLLGIGTPQYLLVKSASARELTAEIGLNP